jgi:hypothetical protein
VGQRKGRGGGRKEKGAPTGGTDVLATAGKGKRRRGRGPLQKGINGPAGRLGRKEGEVPFLFSFFQTLLKLKPFQLKFIQNFSNFFTKFYKLFKPHTSNQKLCIAN